MSLSDYYFDDAPMVICGKPMASICSNIDDICPSVVDRFFKRFYYRRPGTSEEDHLVLFHSNRICMIGLAPSHVALRKGVRSVNFNIGNMDRSQNLCSGKGKKGAMNLQENSALALLTCNDGTEYKVYSCFNSKLMEVNTRLLQRPELIAQEGDGYVAVGLPKMQHIDTIKAALMTPEQYAALPVTAEDTTQTVPKEARPEPIPGETTPEPVPAESTANPDPAESTTTPVPAEATTTTVATTTATIETTITDQ